MLDKSIEELNREDKDARDSYADDSDVILAKIAIGGPILGGLFALLEFAVAGGANFGTTHFTPVQFDHPPPEDKAGSFGAIISPRDIDPPNDEGAVVSKWTSLTDEPNLNTAIDGRIYSLLVRRTDPNPDKRQLWWPPLDQFPGFSGRWGPRVTRDPNIRRAGMLFPAFWAMFMSAFAKAKAGS